MQALFDRAAAAAIGALSGAPRPTTAVPIVEDVSLLHDGAIEGVLRLQVSIVWPGAVSVPEHGQAQQAIQALQGAVDHAFATSTEKATADRLAKQAAELRQQVAQAQQKVSGLEQRRRQALMQGDPTIGVVNDLQSARSALFDLSEELNLTQQYAEQAQADAKAHQQRLWTGLRQARVAELNAALGKLEKELANKLRQMVSDPARLRAELATLRQQLGRV